MRVNHKKKNLCINCPLIAQLEEQLTVAVFSYINRSRVRVTLRGYFYYNFYRYFL